MISQNCARAARGAMASVGIPGLINLFLVIVLVGLIPAQIVSWVLGVTASEFSHGRQVELQKSLHFSFF